MCGGGEEGGVRARIWQTDFLYLFRGGGEISIGGVEMRAYIS